METRGGLTGKRLRIPFFTDNDVEDDVGAFLSDSGHDVDRLRDVMATTAADPVIAENCRRFGLVLVTHNVKHFRAIAQNYLEKHGRVDTLCRIELECHQSMAVQRLREFLPIIELEWARRGTKPAGLRISIDRTMIRVHR